MEVLNAPDFLTGGGEMGQLMRKKDWSLTSLGVPDTWPRSLQTMLGVILHSRFPMFIWWGPELICFYNDAYRPSLGKDGKHPYILGQPAKPAWAEIWPIISPLINQVLNGGEATWSEDQLIPIFRNGKIEDVYWTFSYSRINNDEGKPYGVLVTCVETTEKVLNQLRLLESEHNLRILVEQAVKARQKGEEYIAIASHELRNPLTSLKLSLDLLSTQITEQNALFLLNKSREQVKRLVSMTGELLNVSKISAGLLDLKPEIFNLNEIIRESIISIESNGNKNQFVVSGEADIAVRADKFRIEQVLINLLSNASKYSPRGSEIVINVTQDTDTVKVEVRDKGIGIDPEKIPMMFKKFSRLDTENSIEGYGLGLYISDQIITKHGGTLAVRSEIGKGSMFWFTIPLH
jgi:signal transduction histidine kinase